MVVVLCDQFVIMIVKEGEMLFEYLVEEGLCFGDFGVFYVIGGGLCGVYGQCVDGGVGCGLYWFLVFYCGVYVV